MRRMMFQGNLAGIALLLGLVSSAAEAGDWLRFRGPNGSGISSDTKATPEKWSDTHNLKWKVKLPGPGSSWTIIVDDRIYFVSSRTLSCTDAKTGKSIYQERLSGGSSNDGGSRPMGCGQDYGSPVVANGKWYYITRGGDGFVVKLGKEFEQISVNRVTRDSEDFSATPAISNGKIFIRSSKHLYCVANKK